MKILYPRILITHILWYNEYMMNFLQIIGACAVIGISWIVLTALFIKLDPHNHP